jgi:hypothetical protein
MSDCDVCGKPWHPTDEVVLRELTTIFRDRSLFILGTDADAQAIEAYYRSLTSRMKSKERVCEPTTIS